MDRVAGGSDLTKTDLYPPVSEEGVDEEDGPLWPALFGHPV